MKSSPKFAGSLPLALIALCLLMQLSACSTIKRRSPQLSAPSVSCEERAPPEPVPAPPSGSTNWLDWRKAWLQVMGVLALEEEKRVTTAECLDRLRTLNVIR